MTFKGGYEKIMEVHFVISNWIIEHKFELDGPNFTISHVGPGRSNDPSVYITEVCFPIK